VALIQAGAGVFSGLGLDGDEATGANIVRVALEAPLKQIAINAGLEGGVVAEKVRGLQEGWGLNASTGEYVDLIKTGIIDPAKVTRSALQNAASIAALFLTTAVVIVDKPEKNAAPGRRHGRHGRHGLLRSALRVGPSRYSAPPVALHDHSSTLPPKISMWLAGSESGRRPVQAASLRPSASSRARRAGLVRPKVSARQAIGVVSQLPGAHRAGIQPPPRS
jgi:hypothetical protein